MTHPLLRDQDLPLWRAARPYLDVRNNDEHTLVAYGLAKCLLALTPTADADIVLPAILLHDVGWKKIDPDFFELLPTSKTPTYKALKEIIFATKGDINIEAHVFKNVLPQLKDPNTSLLYLCLFSLKEKNTNHDIISIDKVYNLGFQLNIEENQLRNSLKQLSHYKLITLSSTQVTLKKTWIY